MSQPELLVNFKIEICFKVKIMSDPINLQSAAAEVGVDRADLQMGACLPVIFLTFSSPCLFLSS